MKIALGTAQFDKDYGINRINRKFTYKQKKNLVSFVKKNNIKTIDTAYAYKNAEKDLGRIGVKNFEIITKLPKLKKTTSIETQVTSATSTSLEKLKLKSLYGLLIHNLDDLNSKNRNEYLNTLKKLKKNKIVKKIGVSLYNIQDLKKIMRYWIPDIIQVPYSILDRRLNERSVLKKIKKQKIEVHARSIFLQGLLIKKNNKKKFKKWSNIFDNWFLWCKKNKVEPFQAAYLYVKKNDNIKKIIIGIDDIKQIQSIIEIKKKITKFPNLKCKDKKLLNPFNWSSL